MHAHWQSGAGSVEAADLLLHAQHHDNDKLVARKLGSVAHADQ
jgi:hypothetical protein